jgi:mono/diheme cytochrome c family protein
VNRSLYLLLLLTLVGVACSSQKQASEEGSKTAAPQPAQPAAAAGGQDQAKEIFSTRCAVCHGEEGRGDGVGGANLNPKPQDFHDAAFQKSVTDEQIEKVILYGGPAAGKSPQMIANPDLQNQPAVVAALVKRVRQFGQEK